MNKLGLGKKSTVRDDSHHLLKVYDDAKDPYCFNKNIKNLVENDLPSNWESYLFLHAAPAKAKAYAEKNDIEVVDAGVYKLVDKKYLINPTNPAGKLGKDFPNKAMPRFGIDCAFDNLMNG